MVVQHPVNCEALPGPALSNRSLWQRRAKLASLQALWPWRSDFNLNGYTSVPPKWNGNYTVQKAHEEETAGYGEASTSLPVLRGTLEKHLPRLDPGEAWLLQEGLQGPTVCGVHNLFNSYFWGCFLETTGYITLHEVEVIKTQLSSSSVKEIWKKGENNAISLQLLLCQGKIALFIRILPVTAQQFSWAAKVVTCSGQVTWEPPSYCQEEVEVEAFELTL